MIEYPKKLDLIFNKLKNKNATPIIVGGFVRDFLLKIPSKDIDIEVYGISSFDSLESILEEFGSVNSVGKSFGVCKLQFDNLDLDFSLPRKDSKISSGHKGFVIEVNSSLDFKMASSRRDFTINAIGYDVLNKKILDPFNGIDDLENKILRFIDKNKFQEDPLRILRAVQFSARFHLKIDKNLLDLCQNMCKLESLKELPKERIFDEIQKLLLKSNKPSYGLKILKKFNALNSFPHLKNLNDSDWKETLNAIDEIKKTTPKNLILILSALCHKLNQEQIKDFIFYLTKEKEILKQVLVLVDNSNHYSYKDSQLYRLATKLKIEELVLLNMAISKKNPSNYKKCELIQKRAKELNILNSPYKALLEGKDILNLGIQPSKIYSKILNTAYEAQINNIFKTYNEAKRWLKIYIDTNPNLKL